MRTEIHVLKELKELGYKFNCTIEKKGVIVFLNDKKNVKIIINIITKQFMKMYDSKFNEAIPFTMYEGKLLNELFEIWCLI